MEPKATNSTQRPLKPTFGQRFYASRCPELIWFGGSALLASITCLWLVDFRLEFCDTWSTVGWFVLVGVIGLVLGIFLATFPGCFVYGPTMYGRSLINGAPFRVGDRVQIIGGKFDGQIAEVYSGWQGDAVRVELGEAAKKDLTDLFSSTQLLRVSDAVLADS